MDIAIASFTTLPKLYNQKKMPAYASIFLIILFIILGFPYSAQNCKFLHIPDKFPQL